MTWNCIRFRRDFPSLSKERLYLDSAATALKPKPMIAAVTDYYRHHTANAARSSHRVADWVTEHIDCTRQNTADFIGACNASDVIWTKGATEAANLIANSYALAQLKPGDEIIVSECEHHSNLIPWLRIAELTGAIVVPWPLSETQQLDLTVLTDLLNDKTRLVAVTQMSNVTGYQPDLSAIIKLVHNAGAVVAVDGAQGVVHTPVNVHQLDVDFYFFSTHKLYGPTGLGVLYVKPELLEDMPAWQGGGKMVKRVSFSGFVPDVPPAKFEAGTLNIASILGFNATLNWLKNWDRHEAERACIALADTAERALNQLPGFVSYRQPNSPLLAFNVEHIHHSDIAILLSQHDIAVRAGGLCAIPLIHALGVTGVVRACFAPYTTEHEMRVFVNAVEDAVTLLPNDSQP